MGHWGHGIWENDTAMDIEGTFQDEIKVHDTKAGAMIATIEGYKRSYEDSDITLALADLQIEYRCIVSRDIIKQAIEICEKKENIEDWSQPERRENELNKLLPRLKKSIGAD